MTRARESRVLLSCSNRIESNVCFLSLSLSVQTLQSFSVNMLDGSHIVVDTPELLFDTQQYTIDIRGHPPLREFWTNHIKETHSLEQEPLVCERVDHVIVV